MDEGSQKSLRWLVLINGGGPDHTQEEWESSEESGDEGESHAEVEDRPKWRRTSLMFRNGGWGR